MKLTSCTTLLAALLLAPVGMSQNLLTNPGFENGDFSGWSTFGGTGVDLFNPPEFDPLSGAFLAKVFGDFNPAFSVSGIFQSFPATAGQSFTMDCWSRHWSGDPMTGAGNPNDNWALMKIAFFDAGGTEIGGVEQLICDGSFPQDVWIDNPPVSGVAPPGTTSVQPFILFLQPALDGGAVQIDDVEFFGPPAESYPGTGEDLRLFSALNGAFLTGGAGNDIKQVAAGDLIELNVRSSGGTFDAFPFIVFAQLFPTGFPATPNPIFPSLYFDFITGAPLVLLQAGLASPIGSPLIAPNGGTSLYFVTPIGLGGTSLMVQGLVVDPSTASAFYAATSGHELQFQ